MPVEPRRTSASSHAKTARRSDDIAGRSRRLGPVGRGRCWSKRAGTSGAVAAGARPRCMLGCIAWRRRDGATSPLVRFGPDRSASRGSCGICNRTVRWRVRLLQRRPGAGRAGPSPDRGRSPFAPDPGSGLRQRPARPTRRSDYEPNRRLTGPASGASARAIGGATVTQAALAPKTAHLRRITN
jgi:hypothetical protein